MTWLLQWPCPPTTGTPAFTRRAAGQVFVDGIAGCPTDTVDTTPDYYKIALPIGTVTPFDLAEVLEFNFNHGCALKYVLRAGRKGDALADLKKARNCLDREISRLEAP